jgi:hypothetical protein
VQLNIVSRKEDGAEAPCSPLDLDDLLNASSGHAPPLSTPCWLTDPTSTNVFEDCNVMTAMNDHRQTDIHPENLEDLLAALKIWADKQVETEAIAVLKGLAKGCPCDISGFPDEFKSWPYIGDPNSMPTANVMFWAFSQDDYEFMSLQRHLERFLEKVAGQHINKMPKPPRQLLLEAWAINGAGASVTTLETEKLSAAICALRDAVIDILKNYSSDILLEY